MQTSSVVQNAYFALKGQSNEEKNDGNTMGIVDKYASAAAASHQLIVPPTPSNILIAFEPTDEFMQQIEFSIGEALPQFRSYMTDFLLNVYLPEVSAQMIAFYDVHVNALDAFQTEMVHDVDFPLIKVFDCKLERSSYGYHIPNELSVPALTPRL